ncbi:MAG: SLC13 family permease [Candidatus Omnitrophica bacterium]|nr:SLC13 family permease [Candidatus Omnitrophota bacterium]MDD5436670.1 SLC13 family permease [Candidatus Omnitrophota bacterium]
MIRKFTALIAIALSLGLAGKSIGLDLHQSLSVSIFSASILGTLFFWDFRLSFAFLGTALLLVTRTIDIEHLVRFASLEVILFLVCMMVLVGLLKENGFFNIVSHLLLGAKRLNSRKFLIILSVVSAIMAAMVDEVTSIIFMVIAILEICDKLEIDPVPFLITSVLATNIGSSATVLGNPIGILIATKSGLTFEDFLVKASPLAALCLIATICICLVWYKKALKAMDERLRNFKDKQIEAMEKPMKFSKDLKISLAIFGSTLVIISLHHRLEILWGLNANTILLAAPLVACSAIFVWKQKNARVHIERDVEWWTLLFFLFLFAQAGTLQYTGATNVLAGHLVRMTSGSFGILTGAILWISSIGSAVLDNVVLVAAIIPIIQSFKAAGVNSQALWWALLFGGCLGGNITLVGSTANIVALGILEKQKNIRMTFLKWFGIGLTVGIITTCIVWIALLVIPTYR